jgi:hypothetical protein
VNPIQPGDQPIATGSQPFPYDRVDWLVDNPTDALRLAGAYMQWYQESVKGTPRQVDAAKLRERITFSITPSLLDSTAMPNRNLSIPGCWSVKDGQWVWEAGRYSRIDARGRSGDRLERVTFSCYNTP